MMHNRGEMPMMGMMRKMMESNDDFNPMEMCQNVLRTVTKTSEMSFYVTPKNMGQV